MVSREQGVLIERLDILQRHLVAISESVGILREPDVREAITDAVAERLLVKDTPANLHGRFARLLDAVASKAKVVGGGEAAVDAVIDVVAGVATEADGLIDQGYVERLERKVARAELKDGDE